MLAQSIFHAFAVVIKHLRAIGSEADVLGWRGKHLLCAATCCRHLIHFAQRTRREQRTLCRVLYACLEIHPSAIGRECHRLLFCRVGGQTHCSTTGRRHHKHVEIAVTVAREGNLLAVGAPYRVAFVTGLCGEAHCRTTCRRHFPDVAFVAKCNLLAVRRDFCRA